MFQINKLFVFQKPWEQFIFFSYKIFFLFNRTRMTVCIHRPSIYHCGSRSTAVYYHVIIGFASCFSFWSEKKNPRMSAHIKFCYIFDFILILCAVNTFMLCYSMSVLMFYFVFDLHVCLMKKHWLKFF